MKNRETYREKSLLLKGIRIVQNRDVRLPHPDGWISAKSLNGLVPEEAASVFDECLREQHRIRSARGREEAKRVRARSRRYRKRAKQRQKTVTGV